MFSPFLFSQLIILEMVACLVYRMCYLKCIHLNFYLIVKDLLKCKLNVFYLRVLRMSISWVGWASLW